MNNAGGVKSNLGFGRKTLNATTTVSIKMNHYRKCAHFFLLAYLFTQMLVIEEQY